MRIVFLGSGAFGLPTLDGLLREHEVALVVTQPDRPAGRGRSLQATPVGEESVRRGLTTIKPPDVNAPAVIEQLRAIAADAWVVIAFGQKLGVPLLADRFAINLHASLLPRWRGAAPINHAMIAGDSVTGVSVITLAQRMDAGEILATASTRVDPHETAGELHDRLARLGPGVVLEVLAARAAGRVIGRPQEEALATRAAKLSRADSLLDFRQPAPALRGRIHGLTPWPACTIRIGDAELKLLRVEDLPESPAGAIPGTLLDDGTIATGSGRLRLLAVQPPGGKSMTFEAFLRGHPVPPGAVVQTATRH